MDKSRMDESRCQFWSPRRCVRSVRRLALGVSDAMRAWHMVVPVVALLVTRGAATARSTSVQGQEGGTRQAETAEGPVVAVVVVVAREGEEPRWMDRVEEVFASTVARDRTAASTLAACLPRQAR